MLLLALALLLQDDPSAAALEEFKSAYPSKDVAARAAAVSTLAATQHDKVYAKLGQLLALDEKEVRIAAARGLGACTAEKKARPAAYLVAGAQANLKNPPVLAAILEALGKLKQEAALPELEKHLRSKDLLIGQAALKAVQEVGSSRSVPSLIQLLKWLEENARAAPDYGGVGGGGQADAAAQERDRILSPLVNQALKAITGQSLNGRKAWEDWQRSGGRSK